jgi:hypothetical protein
LARHRSGNSEAAAIALDAALCAGRRCDSARGSIFGGRYSLGVGYQEAHRDLEAQLDTELARLSPQAREEVEANLAIIRGAIGQINRALAEEPDNPLLQELLLQTYREELALMQRVGGLTQHVMSRRDI